MNTTLRPTKGFWVIAIIATIWNLMGAFAYLTQKLLSPETLALLPEAEQDLITNTPIWATVAFAIAVWLGLAGAIALLFRKKIAKQLFTISFLGIIIQMIYNFIISNALEVYGPGGVLMPISIFIIGLFLIIYSQQCIKKGWIN